MKCGFRRKHFSESFQWIMAQIEYSRLEKCFLRNPHFIFCSSFQHLPLDGGRFYKRHGNIHPIHSARPLTRLVGTPFNTARWHAL
jgi:hypothetical protein